MGRLPLSRKDLAAMTPEEFWQILHAVPDSQPVFYRLYYDNTGRPICYSMEHLPGTYIDIDQAAYARSSKWVRVLDGKMHAYRPWLQPKKLVPGEQGTECDSGDIMIVKSAGHIKKWSVKTYDQD